jgi:hypothetical protein
VLVFAAIVDVALPDAFDVLFEPASSPIEDMSSRISVSVDCHRTCIISAHTVALVIIAASIVIRVGFSGIAPSPWVDVEYILVRVPVRVLPQKIPPGSGLGPVPTK